MKKKACTLAEVIITNIIILIVIISYLITHINIEVINTNPKIEKSTQYDYNFAE